MYSESHPVVCYSHLSKEVAVVITTEVAFSSSRIFKLCLVMSKRL